MLEGVTLGYLKGKPTAALSSVTLHKGMLPVFCSLSAQSLFTKAYYGIERRDWKEANADVVREKASTGGERGSGYATGGGLEVDGGQDEVYYKAASGSL